MKKSTKISKKAEVQKEAAQKKSRKNLLVAGISFIAASVAGLTMFLFSRRKTSNIQQMKIRVLREMKRAGNKASKIIK